MQGFQYPASFGAIGFVSIHPFADGNGRVARRLTILSIMEPASEQKRLDRGETDLLSHSLQFGSVALSEAIDILPHLSRRTPQRKLKNLADAGFLMQKGTARNTRYYWFDPPIPHHIVNVVEPFLTTSSLSARGSAMLFGLTNGNGRRNALVGTNCRFALGAELKRQLNFLKLQTRGLLHSYIESHIIFVRW